MNRTSATTTLIAIAGLSSATAIAESGDSFEGAAKEAWLTGRIETMYLLNEHLNPFTIDTDVDGSIAHLTGTVESDIDRDLAGELARGIKGITEVRNDLVVDAEMAADATKSDPAEDKPRNFGSWVDDATTTAAVKSRLIRNANTKGLQIDVDTYDDVVTLSGRVQSDEEKSLAAEIARNSSDVEDVRNNLVVDPS
jgi:osmotically-inducible protein OsmY